MSISGRLQAFAGLDFKTAALNLFKALGYESQRNNINAAELALLQHEEVSNEPCLLFQLTDENIQVQSSAFQSVEKEVKGSIILSYLFVGLELKKANYSRTELIGILRKINKEFALPVLILFKYGEYLAFGVIHRRLHKKDSGKDVFEKVSLIKDIYINEPHRGHLDILNSLAFVNLKPRPNNFVELHECWRKVLDISVLNEKFYVELSGLFTELVGGTRGKEIFKTTLKLPSITDEQVLKEFAVRLIGRLLFCWFLQKKTSEEGISLIPEHILSSESVQNQTDFYHAVLEKLFFETLNKPIEQRKLDFQTGEWAQIPFLNGGLFEAHPYDFYDYSCTENPLIVPNEWLQKLLAFFERYHFTIEENTPLDVQVAIEPEMLGQIFENLLAEINPETGETARKSTGSYYTPREIVAYMVDESLIAYFMAKLPDLAENNLRALFSYEMEGSPFAVQDADRILQAIDSIKILDPACGSGAFPMEMLQKLTLLLSRLDGDCSKWLNHLLNNIPDTMAREFMRKKLVGERALWNYTRKLGILRECIYGVDIQPIAVEISRLRCFLSLVVDEKVEDDKPNRGIIPLPNLDFKFVCANTLIGCGNLDWQLYESQTHQQVKTLENLRERYLNSQAEEKLDLRREFEATQGELFKIIGQWVGKDSELSQLATWKPFGDESCHWFDAFWMFGIKDGFDVVIGNPPYVRQEAIKHLKADLKHFTVFTGTSDLFTYFYELGFNVLKENGVLAFITSNKWMRAKYGEKLRDFFLTKTQLLQLIDFKGKQIFDATVDSNILLFRKQSPVKEHCFLTGEDLPNFEKPLKPLAQHFLNKKAFVLGDESVQALKAKIEKIGTPLKNWDVKIYRGILTGFNEAFIIDNETKNRLCAEDPKSEEIIKPVLRGRDIKRYGYEWAGLWLIHSHNNPPVDIEYYPAIKKHLDNFYPQLEKRLDKGKTPYNLRNCAYWQDFEKEKIVYPDIAGELCFSFDDRKYFISNTAYFFTGKNH
jgi:adenine-specific DNA-methyltransferase